MGILRIRDPVLYPYRRLHSVACVFFRWHEKCEPAQLCKILFLPSDPSCNFRNRGCHHWRCSSQRCCILLRFPLLIGKNRTSCTDRMSYFIYISNFMLLENSIIMLLRQTHQHIRKFFFTFRNSLLFYCPDNLPAKPFYIVTAVCTVDLLILNTLAAALTVAPVSNIYSPNISALSFVASFIQQAPPIGFFYARKLLYCMIFLLILCLFKPKQTAFYCFFDFE